MVITYFLQRTIEEKIIKIKKLRWRVPTLIIIQTIKSGTWKFNQMFKIDYYKNIDGCVSGEKALFYFRCENSTHSTCWLTMTLLSHMPTISYHWNRIMCEALCILWHTVLFRFIWLIYIKLKQISYCPPKISIIEEMSHYQSYQSGIQLPKYLH